jgi:hypothetical protein
VVGRRGENFGAEKRWKKKIHASREDGIFVHLQNDFNGLILNWCIGGCWFTPALLCANSSSKVVGCWREFFGLFPMCSHKVLSLFPSCSSSSQCVPSTCSQ